MPRIRALPGARIAIRYEDRLLAVPPMHPQTPSAIRVQVFELVLRRLWGEALELAVATNDAIENRSGETSRIAALMSATPHRNSRGAIAA